MADGQEQAKEQTTETFLGLEEARLQIGDLVNLQTQTQAAVERYSVRLIGLVKGRSVLVTSPMADGHYLLMREGQGFILRAFAGKSAYAFSTQILKSVNTPFPYLHLAYPREVRSLVVRKGSRADVKVICAVSACDDASQQAAGTIVNLSVGGALITFRQPFGNKGDQLTVKFKVVVSGIEAFLELKAVVRAILVDPTGDTEMRNRLGVQFVDISSDDSIPLLAFVYQELLEQSLGS
jgi:c-di-GMP-binding flagellar brake protein YcgR